MSTLLPDEQEALSRCYSNDVIILLPLSSGAVAIFNSARELCGIIAPLKPGEELWWHNFLKKVWHPPAKAPERPPRASLEDLGL